MSEDLGRLLREAALAVRAAVAALPPARRGRDVAMGADGEPTTAVDRAAESALVRVLEGAPFPLTLISEEAGEVELVPGDNPLFVLADPVDSTKNAIVGLPFYATALAAYRDGELRASVVMNLATGDAYEALRGDGARFNGRQVSVRPVDLAEAIVAFGPIREEQARRVLARLAVEAGGVRLFACPSLGVADVGSGRLGGFLGLGSAGKVHRLFDVAASLLFAREAGATVTDAHGAEIPHLIHDLRRAVTIVAAPQSLHATLLAMVDGAS